MPKAIEDCSREASCSVYTAPALQGDRLGVELAVVFMVLPVVVGLWVPPPAWLPSLWLIASLAGWRMWRDTNVKPTGFWARIDWRRSAPELQRIAVRFALSAVLLLVAMQIYAPARLFDLPQQQPLQWAAVMVLYPVFSVYPQEVLYRRYMFYRLHELRLSATQIVWVSAVAFAALHWMFRNEIAVVLTLLGGWLFADTYRRTGSLRLVCFEHALYGNLIFTIGLGDFFFHGAVRV